MTRRQLVTAACFSTLSAAGLLIFAGYNLWEARRTLDARIEVPDPVLEAVAAGTPRVVEYTIVNGGSDPLRLVGAESC